MHLLITWSHLAIKSETFWQFLISVITVKWSVRPPRSDDWKFSKLWHRLVEAGRDKTISSRLTVLKNCYAYPSSVVLCPQRLYRLLGTGSPGHPSELSHSSCPLMRDSVVLRYMTGSWLLDLCWQEYVRLFWVWVIHFMELFIRHSANVSLPLVNSCIRPDFHLTPQICQNTMFSFVSVSILLDWCVICFQVCCETNTRIHVACSHSIHSKCL